MSEPNEPLHLRFRPARFEDVIGNDAEIDAIADAINKKRVHTYMFIGPSGVGKTTLARIAANKLGAIGEFGLSEINAAKYTGVEDMRELQDMMIYPAFGSPVRCIILDECHALTPNAWQSLLKMTEEPPLHVYWFFCTTNDLKIPATIRTRALICNLRSVSENEIKKLVERVGKKARIKLLDGVAELIAREADGSPRQALVFLEKIDGAPDYETVERNLQQLQRGDDVIEFCRYLCGRNQLRWQKAASLIKQFEDKRENPEGIRILMVNYVAKALAGAKTEKDALYFLSLLNHFSTPFQQAEKFAPLWLATGRVVFNR